MNYHQVSVAAESFTAALFAWTGFDISVQYGPNQPEYDLVVLNGSQMLKVSVKGSQAGGWGLTQSYKKGRTYHEAADMWVNKHTAKTIVSLLQFKNVDIVRGELPRVYLATPHEIGLRLKESRRGFGETILKEKHTWKSGIAVGHVDNIPDSWKFSKERINDLLKLSI
ncbi:MAG: hypothetical protein ACQEWH_08125 [Bacillota bacterium]